MKRMICMLLLVVLMVAMTACGAGSTSADDQGNRRAETRQEETEVRNPTVTYRVGDTITLGGYNQQRGTWDYSDEIEWNILAVENGRALVISKYVLEALPYNKYGVGSGSNQETWETCSLRAWLNGDFLNSAFTDEERSRILTTEVIPDANPFNDIDPGNITQDKVFILNVTEMLQYLPANEDRMAEATVHCVEDLFEQDGYGPWWLRTPGKDLGYAMLVLPGGECYIDNEFTFIGDTIYLINGVRPVMWITIG